MNKRPRIPFYDRIKLLISSLLLTVCCSFCNSRTADNRLDDSEEGGLTGRGKFAFPENLLVHRDYIGTCGDAELLVRFDSISEHFASGILYDLSTSAEAIPQKFEFTAKKKKVQIAISDVAPYGIQQSDKTAKQCAITATDSTFLGEYTIDKTRKTFKFRLYKTPDFQTFKNRYAEKCYPYTITPNVEYGKAVGYWTRKPMDNNVSIAKTIASGLWDSQNERTLSLKMDIYQPTGEPDELHPLILFIHGGAFYIGDKEDNPIVLWCKHYAELGYVVASIDYRMGFLPTQASIERSAYQAAQDANAAMRYLLHYKDKYRINPDYLFAAGSSAGSITALNLAFMTNSMRPKSSKGDKNNADLGSLETSGNKFTEKFKIKAVANMWGAVNDIAILHNANTSVISFHGDADKIVPYGHDMPFQDLKLGLNKLFFDKMYGSACISQKAKELGYRQEMHTFKGCGHSPHVDENNQPNKYFYFIQEKTTQFFYKELLPQKPGIQSVKPQYYQLKADKVAKVYWQVEGGLILAEQGNNVRVVWFRDATKHKLTASGYVESGATFLETLEN